MLYNVIFGNNELLKDEWNIVKEPTGTYLAKDDISQKVRYPKDLPIPPLTEKYHTNTVQCYDLGANLRWSANPYNMNPAFRLVNAKDHDQSESIVVYVNVMSNYQIIEFTTPYQILQTYHKVDHGKGIYQGCVLVLTKEEVQKTKNGNLLTILAYNTRSGRACTLTCGFNVTTERKPNGKTTIDFDHMDAHIKGIHDKKKADDVSRAAAKNEGKYLGFKCVVKPGTFVTNIYFVAEKYEQQMKDLVYLKNAKIVPVPTDVLRTKAKLEKLVHDTITPGKIRAITTVGIKIPLDTINKNRILYVFDYDPRKDKMDCTKSH